MAGLHVVAGVDVLTIPVRPEFEPAQLVDVPLVQAVDRNVAEQTGSPVRMPDDVISGTRVDDVPTRG